MNGRDHERDEVRRVVAILAEHLLAYAGDDFETMPPCDGDAGRVVMVHAKDCPGSCDYGCGAVAITMSGQGPDAEIDEVGYGQINVRGLAEPT